MTDDLINLAERLEVEATQTAFAHTRPTGWPDMEPSIAAQIANLFSIAEALRREARKIV